MEQLGVALEVRSLASTPDILVAVVNYNGIDDTVECVQSLKQSTYDDFSLIVIDNGSTDDSATMIRDRMPGIRIARIEQNLGYASAVNRAVEIGNKLGARFCLVLNNDLVVESKTIESLAASATRLNRVAALGPMVLDYYQSNRILALDEEIDLTTGWPIHSSLGDEDDGRWTELIPVNGYLDGCALMFNLRYFDEVGAMDESFFLYYEESDWCYRARSRNYRLVVNPIARVWHKVGRSTQLIGGKLGYLVHRNRVIFEKRYATETQWLAFWAKLPWHTFIAPRIRTTRTRLGNPPSIGLLERAETILKGLVDGLFGGGIFAESYGLPHQAPTRHLAE